MIYKMKKHSHFSLICIALMSTFSMPTQAADQEWVLPPIVAEGTPSDALKYDPISPAIQGETPVDTGTGGLSHGISNQLPFHMADNGRPGNIATFVGLGANSEETDVNVFGIPLNGPEGGGFDLSTFPQYLWSGFTFQSGPSLGAFDPRAIAGSLSLTPWTQQALNTKDSGARITAFDSSERLQQFSVAGKSKGDMAAVVGMSTGAVTGPAGSLSGRWGSGDVSGKYHFIATYQDVTNLKSFYASSTGEQTTWRYIPVVQADVKTGPNSLLKSSFFYDSSYLRSDQGSIQTRAQVRQGGVESAYLYQDWKFGLGARQTDYHSRDFVTPTEEILNLSATKTMDLSGVIFSPTLSATGVSRLGTYPGASIGARKEFGNSENNEAVFSRLSYAKRFPSLADRYYSLPPYAVGNPNLVPETSYTYTLGVELKRRDFETSLSGYYQYRNQSEYYVSGTQFTPGMMINAGNAYIYSLTHTVGYSPSAWFTLSNRLNMTKSYVYQTNGPFTYMPAEVDVLSAEVHQTNIIPKWALFTHFRASSSFYADSTTILSGYDSLDLGGRLTLTPNIELNSTIENVFDRHLELIQGSLTDGRIYTVTLVGSL